MMNLEIEKVKKWPIEDRQFLVLLESLHSRLNGTKKMLNKHKCCCIKNEFPENAVNGFWFYGENF